MPVKAVRGVVIDATVALKGALVAEGFAGWQRIELHAPSLIWSEVASAASQLRWRGEVSAEQAAAALGRLRGVALHVAQSADLVADALELAHRFGWAKTYDAEYVALAMRLELPLVTTDGRLAGRLRSEIAVLTPIELDELVSAGGP